ncbi:MAG TPA: hypothetical protein VGK73_23800, partial [Polyangiaceae bacterium]
MQGFQNAGDALFPPVKTYLDAPGYRVAPGGYSQANFLSGDEVYVAARSAADRDALFLMHYASPEPCSLPRVGRFYAFGPPASKGLLLSYFEDSSEPGTLRFADGNCKTFELTIEGARLPYAAGDDGLLLVESGSDLLAVNPSEGEVTTVATGLTRILAPSSFGTLEFLTGDRLGIVTSTNSTQVQWFGRRVVEAVSTSQALFFEDADGVHEITATDLGEVVSISERRLDPDGCHLAALPAPDLPGAYYPAEWIAYNAGCTAESVIVRDTRRRVTMVLGGHALDARFLKVIPTGDAAPSEFVPSLETPVFVFYLAGVDPESGRGELHVVSPSGEDHAIGFTSALDRALLARRTFEGAPGYDHGFALLDIEGGLGRLVVWRLDGSTRTVAERVRDLDLTAPWPLFLSDFEGGTGTLVQLARGEPHALATRVPDYGGAWPNYSDYQSGDALLFSDFDGSS